MPQFRIPPSGAFFSGTAAGQVPVWNGTEWLPQTPSPGGQELYDYVLSSRDDLVDVVAPVGGVFELPSGSYAITASFALNTDESLNVANGELVLMTSFGFAQLSGEPTSGTGTLLNIEAGADVELQNCVLRCNGNTNECIVTAGTLRIFGGAIHGGANSTEALHVADGDCQAVGVEFTAGASSSVFFMLDGTARFTGCAFTGGQAFACVQSGGELHMTSCSLVGGTSQALALDGANVMRAVLTDCYLTAGSTNAVLVQNGASADLELANCDIVADAINAHCVRVTAGRYLLVSGGVLRSLSGTPGDGVQLGGVLVGMTMVGTRGENLDDFVQRVSGTVLQASITACSSNAAGINWAAANMPTNGLAIVGCNFAAANPFTGFTAASARVNVKACTGAALLQETAIVP